MNHLRWIRVAAAAAALTAVGPPVVGQPAVGADEDAALALYYPFVVGKVGNWQEVTVALDPARWHVGRPDGPAATRVQLAAVLAEPRLIVLGARCKSVRSGRTVYPCGFELGMPAGAAGGNALTVARNWAPISGDQLTRYDSRGQPASWVTTSSEDAGASGVLTAALKGIEDDFIGWFTVRDSDLGDRLVRGRPAALRMRFRVVSSSHAKPLVEPLGGALILSNRDAGLTLVPSAPPVSPVQPAPADLGAGRRDRT